MNTAALANSEENAEAKKTAAFVYKAREALHLHDLAIDEALVARVVEAMRWAQSQ